MKTIRLFQLLDNLRSRIHPVSALTLAQALNVSERTIYRDMATLQSIGAPIRGESGLGYVLNKGHFLPPLSFDTDELDAIMLGVRLLAARADDDLGAAIKRVSAKVAAVLDDNKKDTYQRLPLRAVSKPSNEITRANGHLTALRLAIRQRQQLAIHYVDLKNNESHRTVRPLGLTIFDTVWILTVWCEVRSDFRNLRVDNIVTATPTGAHFQHERGKRFEDYLKTL
jgi:predicted DNA-binding transcriptional regulator YafY